MGYVLPGNPSESFDLGLGFPYCYGVFRAYFFTHPPFEGVAYVSVAGVLSNVRLVPSRSLLSLLMTTRGCYKYLCHSCFISSTITQRDEKQ